MRWIQIESVNSVQWINQDKIAQIQMNWEDDMYDVVFIMEDGQKITAEGAVTEKFAKDYIRGLM